MPVLNRPTLKRYFETGKGLSNQGFTALIDSMPSLQDSTAQTFNSDIIVGQIVTPVVSAGEAAFQTFNVSAATFAGIVQQGVSGARGSAIVSQEATVAATATSQVALLPDSVNIVELGVKVLAASSGAVGGTQIQIGNGDAVDYFGNIVVSAVGNHRLTDVCARRLQGVSGAVFAAGITASGNANFVPYVQYYKTAAASGAAVGVSLVTAANVSAIGNLDGNGGIAAAFDDVTDAGAGGCATISSVKGFVGQSWNVAKKIGQVQIWDPSNDYFTNIPGGTTIRLYGNNTNNILTAAVLASIRAENQIPTIIATIPQTDIITTNAYPYHWIDVSAVAGQGIRVAEVKFMELV